MIIKSSYNQAEEYITKDSSIIRELLHPKQHNIQNQSLAEAQIPPGVSTLLHLHPLSEEIYHVTKGSGLMTLEDQQLQLLPGDSVCIPPGTAHCICNNGDANLVILCCCAPAYSHADTELL